MPYHLAMSPYFCVIGFRKKGRLIFLSVLFGADDEARTRYLHLGKVALYRMSYIRTVGASGRNRTSDTRIFRPLLYQLSYRRKYMKTGIAGFRRNNGDPERSRTVDL